MSILKLAHIADLHISHPQYGVKQRQQNMLKSYVDLLSELKRFDAVLVAGDVFNDNEPSPRDVKFWGDFVSTLKEESGVDVFVNTGNHDKVLGAKWQWIDTAPHDSLERCRKRGDTFEYHTNLLNKGTSGIKILCFDHIHRKDIKAVVDGIPEKVDIIMMHQSACGFLPSIMRPEIDEDTLKALSEKCRYLALGDLHVHKVMKVSKKCHAAYPGNLDFLRIGDVTGQYKFLSLEFEVESDKPPKITSVPFEPYQVTQVIEVEDSIESALDGVNLKDCFNVIRCNSSTVDEARKFVESYDTKRGEETLFHIIQKKDVVTAPSKDDEAIDVTDHDFIDLVSREKSLEERDVQIVESLWESSGLSNVEQILKEDLKEQIKELETQNEDNKGTP